MNKVKRENLEKKGWKVGSSQEFLGLTPEEESYIEMKLSLSQYLQEKRKDKHLTQVKLAKLIESSQSRVAKMEKSEPSVSLDLIVRTLFALGADSKEMAEILIGINEDQKRTHNKAIKPDKPRPSRLLQGQKSRR